MGQHEDSVQAWLELPNGKLHPMGQQCKIGRSPKGNDLVIDDGLVSNRHLIINAVAGGFELIDLRTTNGTYVNGTLVGQPTLLKDGDEIRPAKVPGLRFRCIRELNLDGPASFEKSTTLLNQCDTRECWLLLVDVADYSGQIAKFSNEGALKRLQAWFAEVRPLIEGHGGVINSYLGDGIFSYWRRDHGTPQQVLATLRALEDHRRITSLGFRFVVHHGPTLFSKSSLGEEIFGQDVNFVFRVEKIAKRLACDGMLSEVAVASLQLAGRCDAVGTSPVDGIAGEFKFYRLPPDLSGTAVADSVRS